MVFDFHTFGSCMLSTLQTHTTQVKHAKHVLCIQFGAITLIKLVGQLEKKYADNKHVFHSNSRQWMILVHIICKIVYKNRKVTKCLSIAYLCKINSRWHQRNANKRIESKWNVYNCVTVYFDVYWNVNWWFCWYKCFLYAFNRNVSLNFHEAKIHTSIKPHIEMWLLLQLSIWLMVFNIQFSVSIEMFTLLSDSTGTEQKSIYYYRIETLYLENFQFFEVVLFAVIMIGI